MMLLYSLLLGAAAVLSAPVWGWRMLRQGRYRQGLRERLGVVPARLAAAVQGREVVWLHAVSVGELIAATRLLSELETALPSYVIVISTTTPTGQQVARERFGVDRVFFFPLDFAFAVRAYLRVLRPRLLILMESELWPRTLVESSRAGVPVAVINARVSDRSLPRYMALRRLWRPLLRHVTLLLAQSEEDALRWRAIGAERVESTGNLKYDVREIVPAPLPNVLRQHLLADARVLVCGSTHEGEEQVLLDCMRGFVSDKHVMILAPRHPERTGRVEQLAAERGIQTQRLSAWRVAPVLLNADTVLLVDTVGELAALYSLAHVAFVGGSLVPHGGQNPLEPARFGVPVLMGPSYENFRDIVAAMQHAGVLTLVDEKTVGAALEASFAHELSAEQRERSRAFFQEQSGATQRTLARLLPLVERGA